MTSRPIQLTMDAYVKKRFWLILVCCILLAGCGKPTRTSTPVTQTIGPTSTRTRIPTRTRTPVPSHTPQTPSATAVIPVMVQNPVFLAWPLPTYIGTVRISQYPNTPWTWNYLGLNQGHQCPPLSTDLINTDWYEFWRDTWISLEEDKAQADPHQFDVVECYATDGEAGTNGHAGTDITAPAGTPVYAAAEGLVYKWRENGLSSMVVLQHCVGGEWNEKLQCVNGQEWYTTYLHIVPEKGILKNYRRIVQGGQIGTVFDQNLNSHLHFETGLGDRSYQSYVNPWGMDTPPWTGCMWLDQSICANPDSENQRMAFYSDATGLSIKTGNLEAVDVPVPQVIKQINVSRDRIAILDAKDDLYITEELPADQIPSDATSNWIKLAENILDVQMANNRTAILDGNHYLFVKENHQESEWILKAENVQAFSISDHRLGYLTDSGDLFLWEDGQDSGWIQVTNNVLAFQVVDNRIAYINPVGELYSNEGPVDSRFKLMASNINAFQLTESRMGVMDIDSNLFVKAGSLRAEWVLQAEGVDSFQLADDRILMHSVDGGFRYKQGNLYQQWVALSTSGLDQVFLNGVLPVYLR